MTQAPEDVPRAAGVARLSRIAAAAGAGVWICLFLLLPAPSGDLLGRIHPILLLAILVVVPLLLPLIERDGRAGARALRAGIVLQPIAAAAAAASLWLPPGRTAALLALPWLTFAGLVALSGLARLRHRGLIAAEETAIDLGCIYLPVGALWLIASRAGIAPLGFGEPIAILTAVHFHYAGFAAPVLAGLAGRVLLDRNPGARGRLAPIIAGIVIGMPLVAAGITASPILEALGVAILSVGLLGLAAAMLAGAARGLWGTAAGVILAIAALSAIAGMSLAAVYGAGELVGAAWITIPAMVQTHGWINGAGFALLGALAFHLRPPPGPTRSAPPPFSRLSSRGRVGPDFFRRIGAVPPVGSGRPMPRGLVDRLADYRRDDFDTDRVHPEIRDFYEETSSFGLILRPDWAPAFRLLGWLHKWIASRIGQVNFPVAGALHEDRIDSAILPIDEAIDGRRGVRGWVRTYAESGEAIYVAAYADHKRGDQTYMGIAFPLPGGNLASILRLEGLSGEPSGDGIVLTTLPGRERGGDEGVYFANRLLPVRLPLNERIRVRPARGDGGGTGGAEGAPGDGVTILARHDMWLLGIRFLTLHYEIFRRGPARRTAAAENAG